MASSSSSVPDWKYDVFLNFRGEDTRRTFIGHLYKALVQNSINTFVDAEILTVPEESSYVEEMRQRHLEEMRQQEEMRQRHLEEMRQRKEMRQRGRRLEETRQRHLEAMSLRRHMEAMRQRRF
ncbi:hypothetical protein ACFX1Q_028190 [Malus domestica]